MGPQLGLEKARRGRHTPCLRDRLLIAGKEPLGRKRGDETKREFLLEDLGIRIRPESWGLQKGRKGKPQLPSN